MDTGQLFVGFGMDCLVVLVSIYKGQLEEAFGTICLAVAGLLLMGQS